MDYKEIINNAIADYVNRGGSTYRLTSGRGITTHYTFHIEDKTLPQEKVDKLYNTALAAINSYKELPKGITLVSCEIKDDE